VALGTALSANAVQVAPAGLAMTLANATLAGVAVGTGTTFNLLKLMAMTKLQAGIIGTVAAACVLAPLVMEHQAHAAMRQKDATWQQQQDQIDQLTAENGRLSRLQSQARKTVTPDNGQLAELLKLRGEIVPLQEQLQGLKSARTTNPASDAMSLADKEKLWADRLARLKSWADENPGQKIPELKYLTDHDWINSIGSLTLAGPDDFNRAMSTVRANAEMSVLDRLQVAWQSYAKANAGQTPTDVSDLLPYLKQPMDDAIWQRYEIVRSTDLVTNLQGDGDWVITQKAPVNAQFDARQAYGPKGGRIASPNITNLWNNIPNH
jgi:hypothetical protein